MILCIETSTNVCSAAFVRDGQVVAHNEIFDNNAHAANLTPLIEQLAADNNITLQKDVDAVAVSCGPGSYTGLRIGVSTAKGLCYSLKKPLIAIGSLNILASAIASQCPEASVIVPMIDARRMEVYSSVFNSKIEELQPVCAKIIDSQSFSDILSTEKVFFGGDGADKCVSTITSPNAVFVENIRPLASSMASLAQASFDAGKFVDVAYFEPFYLKEFVATVAKNKVL